MGDGGCYGNWQRDTDGLPCFDLDISRAESARLVLPHDDTRLPWHQVGNDRITATAHLGGWTTLYTADEGFVRLNGTDPARPSSMGGTWEVRGGDGRLIASTFTAGDEPVVRWGTGYAEWTTRSPGVELRRRLWAPFGDIPAVRVDVEMIPGPARPDEVMTYSEQWGFEPYPVILGALMSGRVPAPRSHGPADRLLWRALFGASSLSRELIDGLRAYLGERMALNGEFVRSLNAVVLVPRGRPDRNGPDLPRKPSPLSRIPGDVFVAMLQRSGTAHVTPGHDVIRDGSATTVRLGVKFDPAARPTNLSFAVGVAERRDIEGILEELADRSPSESARSWRSVASLDLPTEPVLERETAWHAYYLKGAGVRDSFFDCRYVPQGSAYGFIMGGQGAPRDYAIDCVPLTYIDPPLAKDILRLIMRMTRPDGAIYYAHLGAGQCTSGLIHDAPTDLPLFFLWALTEYVWATRDFAFLDEPVPFWTGRFGRGIEGTVRERALLAWWRVIDGIGRGPHGMLRVGTGDWNDPIGLMVRDSRAFHRQGESGFNTALAVYALERAARLLEPTHRSESVSIDAYVADLRRAMGEAWRGRWFLRGWDGRGSPLGDDRLFLDAQVWCLISGIGSAEQRRILVDTIAETCSEPSPIGATILDRPTRVRHGLLPPGWDCNGGVWAAINGLLAWAYALHDPGLAWRCLRKQSLAAHANAYPRVWYGVWSGPDAFNAQYAQDPGETYANPATPMREFPVMNSNAHAGPLLGLLKVMGIEAGPAGLSVEPRLPDGVGAFRLSTALVQVSSDGNATSITSRAATG